MAATTISSQTGASSPTPDSQSTAAYAASTHSSAPSTQASINSHAASGFAALASLPDDWNAYRGEIDTRLDGQDRRIGRNGAMNAAMSQMAINAGGAHSPRGRIAIGAGFQDGEQALSVGYAKAIGTRGSFSLGGAFSGSERSAGIGFGMDF